MSEYKFKCPNPICGVGIAIEIPGDRDAEEQLREEQLRCARLVQESESLRIERDSARHDLDVAKRALFQTQEAAKHQGKLAASLLEALREYVGNDDCKYGMDGECGPDERSPCRRCVAERAIALAGWRCNKHGNGFVPGCADCDADSAALHAAPEGK